MGNTRKTKPQRHRENIQIPHRKSWVGIEPTTLLLGGYSTLNLRSLRSDTLKTLDELRKY